MNVTFEHPTIIFDDKVAEIIIEFVNHILYADSEETLRQIVADFADKYPLWKIQSGLTPCASLD